MKFYQILFLLGCLAPAVIALSFHGLARRHKNREAKFLNEIQTKLARKHKKNRKYDQKQVLTAFELNHQECDIVRVLTRHRPFLTSQMPSKTIVIDKIIGSKAMYLDGI